MLVHFWMLFSLVIFFSWGILLHRVFSTAVMSVVFARCEYICLHTQAFYPPNCRHHFYKCLWTTMCTTSVFKRLCALPWRGTAAVEFVTMISSHLFSVHRDWKQSGTIYVLVSALAVPYSTNNIQFQAEIYDVMVAPRSLSTLWLTVDNNNVPTA